MGNKGHSRKGLFGTIEHYDEHGKKTGIAVPDSLAVMKTLIKTGSMLATVVRASLVDMSTLTITESIPVIVTLVCLARIITMITTAKIQVKAHQDFSIVTTIQAEAVTLQLAFTVHTIARRCGHSAATAILLLRKLGTVERLLGFTMP